ncbi:MAG: sulfite exporter TauE/SafE family protein [Thermoanaerobaculia bacterium]
MKWCEVELLLLIAALGATTGFLSGLLGIGGGIVMAPLLLYVPPLLGLEPLSMRTVAGLTIVQGLAACISGALTHRRFRFVSDRLVLYMGTTIFAAAALGGAAARFVPDRLLLGVFGFLAAAAAILMLVPVRQDSDRPHVRELDFSRSRAVASAAGVGLLGGLVGQGGSFILIPLMTSFVRVPTRIAIGSNLAIVLLSTTAAFIGKAITGQIEWLLAVPLMITVVPAAHLGGRVSHRVPVIQLRRVLAILISAAAVRIWISVLVP